MQAEEERPSSVPEEKLSPERRAALAKLRKLTSYVPPAIVILALSSRESAASEPPPEP